MRSEGLVIAVDGNMVTVSVVQQSACAGCSASCASCHKKVSHNINVKNTIDAEIGDLVWVESSASRILMICFFVFMLPPVLAGCVCALLWNSVSGLPLALISLTVAGVSFALFYLTLGKNIIAGNEYKLVKKF